jgi:DNA-binding Xre family transcriptional regulator
MHPVRGSDYPAAVTSSTLEATDRQILQLLAADGRMSFTDLGKATGLSQARISQIENGDAVSLDVLRTYVAGLGGQVEIVARIGDISLNVA